jgi:hypothetical protein
MLMWNLDGECGFSGKLTTAAAIGINSDLLNILSPRMRGATHFIRYTTGSTAALVNGETVTANVSGVTAKVILQVIEQGTIGATTAAGILFVKLPSAALTTDTLLTGGTSTGTVVIASGQDFVSLQVAGQPKSCLISSETADINFTMDGTVPTVAAGTNYGHLVTQGASYLITGWMNIKRFQCINSVAGSGAILKYSLFF